MRPAIRPSPKAISNLWPTLEPFKSAKNAHFRVWYNPYYGVVVANVFKYRSACFRDFTVKTCSTIFSWLYELTSSSLNSVGS